MLMISAYRLVAQLYESVNSLIYRGRRMSDEQPIVLKMLKDAYPTPERIAWFKRSKDIAARFGGDEFTILLEGIENVSDAIKVAERIQQELALPFEIKG